MRIILLLIAIAFAADAYFASGAYTKAAVHGITNQVQALTSGVSTGNKREAPKRTETQQQNGQSAPATGGLK